MNNVKGINITWLSRVDLTNLNSGEGESNLVDVKKFKENGEEYPYVSGQAMRRYLREAIRREIDGDFMCVSNDKGETCGDIGHCLNCDLFGFMTTVKGKGAVTRVSPVKVSPAVGLYPFRENSTLDFLTRRKWTHAAEEMRGDIVNVELGVNLYKCGIAIDLVRVGGEEDVDQKARTVTIKRTTNEVRQRERVHRLIEALSFLSDFSKQARLLTDFTPDVICLSLQQRYSHRLQKLFDIVRDNGTLKLNMERIKSVLAEVRDYSSQSFFGLTPGVLSKVEEEELKSIFTEAGIMTQSPREAIAAAIGEIEK
jgi:CRISPR-associated protein Cst2